ncbi:CRISPR-associated endonuclease Cas2 [Fervidobacterium islandicum]|uniref:CRISPR-associated endoribonuclease Cas2 n=2 Tax=Fervidobacterium islandicum TaxID=2423 RepID=A0AAI8GD98_FERIS|nr:CRISPR-associated endonuclease Cas2 [Fervidobacterium islandicum]AMW33132.2 CRISPR-associated endonuclease Cas2 [Fervidobacterium islandicum]
MKFTNHLRRGGSLFVIITYDIGEKRITKVRKIIRKYLFWVQNSVFEGEITEGKLQKCINEIKKVIIEEEDSIFVYKIYGNGRFEKKIIGLEKSVNDEFI